MLVILAAVTLNSIFGNNIIGIATNGALNYAEEQQKELGMLNDVSDMLGEITGDTDKPMTPTITLSGTKGINDIYTSNVTVTISINKGIEQTGSIKLHYKINDGEEQITEEDVSFEIDTEGTTTITAWAENEKGNVSGNAEVSFTINKTVPSNPTISLNGTEGDNNYYKSNVGVTINAGNASNISSIKYKVEGANPIEETEVQGTTANFEITADGTSTITAYIINSAGLTSETITQEVNKDTTSPSTASIALSGEAGETSITVNANGEDSTSGIASYIFQYSTTSKTEGFTTKEEVQNTSNSCTFEYQDLTSNTTYYLRVIVKDRAGNTTESSVIEQRIEQKEINFAELTEEEINGMVGKYIGYTPVSGNFTSSSTYNGYGSSKYFSTDSTLKWRILEVTDNTLTLISDTTANPTFGLESYNGYNNGVKLLNDACAAMYSNSSLGAIGRSINITDIENHSRFDKTTSSEYGVNYGTEFDITYDYTTYYPRIHTQEKTLEASKQNQWYTGYSSGRVTGKMTSYSYEMSTSYMDPAFLELFRYQAGAETNLSNYWIATRCLNMMDWEDGSAMFRWGLFCVESGSVSYKMLYWDDNAITASWAYALRPIVDINLSKVTVGLSGDGSSGSPYSIDAK